MRVRKPTQPLSTSAKYAVALLLVSFAFLIRFLISPLVQHPSPYLLCGLAVFAAASYGGWGPGLFATAVSAMVGWYFYLLPRFDFQMHRSADAVQLISFLIVGTAAAFLADRLRSAKRTAELVAASDREIGEKYRYNLEAANAGTFDWNIATGEVLWSENMEIGRA